MARSTSDGPAVGGIKAIGATRIVDFFQVYHIDPMRRELFAVQRVRTFRHQVVHHDCPSPRGAVAHKELVFAEGPESSCAKGY